MIINHSSPKNIREYRESYNLSVTAREKYWAEESKLIKWEKAFERVLEEDLSKGSFSWFKGGEINIWNNLIRTWLDHGNGDHCVIHHIDKSGNLRSITMDEFSRMIIFSVGRWMGELDNGFRAVVFMEDCVESYVIEAGIAVGGGVSVPVSSRFPVSFVEKIIDDSEPSLVFVNTSTENSTYLKSVQEIAEKHPSVVVDMANSSVLHSKDEIDGFTGRTISASQPLFLFYNSSGSEKPKGYVFEAAPYLLHSAVSMRDIFHFQRPWQISIWAGSLTRGVVSQAYGIWGPLMCQDAVFSIDPHCAVDRDILYKIASIKGPVSILGNPQTLLKFADEAGDEKFNKPFDIIAGAGDIFGPRQGRTIARKLTEKSENVINLWIQRNTGVSLMSTLPAQELQKPGSIGVAAKGIIPEIISEVGHPCQVNESGQIAFSCSWPAMATSIFNQHDRFLNLHFRKVPGYLTTNDGGRKDQDGFWYFMKRLDDEFKINDFSISTSELESTVVSHKHVMEAAVIGVEGAESGDTIVIFTVPDDTVETNEQRELFTSELKIFLREKIGDFALPFQIFILDELPRTRTGKVVRPLLHRIAGNDLSSTDDLSHLSNPDSVRNLLPNGGK
ncbi:MAG: AMP-binding protein [Deltaproteobacteria bacterium]|nr:AMP-binding protein [Deltaproteobacteria bacterium]